MSSKPIQVFVLFFNGHLLWTGMHLLRLLLWWHGACSSFNYWGESLSEVMWQSCHFISLFQLSTHHSPPLQFVNPPSFHSQSFFPFIHFISAHFHWWVTQIMNMLLEVPFPLMTTQNVSWSSGTPTHPHRQETIPNFQLHLLLLAKKPLLITALQVCGQKQPIEDLTQFAESTAWNVKLRPAGKNHLIQFSKVSLV